jgi:hypothetical protein
MDTNNAFARHPSESWDPAFTLVELEKAGFQLSLE